ncbi:c-type cytochrome [Polyangium spumosum]|uniref:Cytochrome C n=1 Tax=Polyangium spumosum TaxID=889282 RepID=A0A6N7PLI0_9BACT|nr:cytochrome C [Polyangium spumosum]MRG91004.1 cytochrome C [Polyangium spumosum]
MHGRRLLTLVLSCLISACAAEEAGEPGETSTPLDERAEIGLQIAPVPLKLEGADRDVVGLGSYLVNAASACVDCHSCPTYAPGESPFTGGRGRLDAANYLGGGVPMGQGIVAPGLTPDTNGLPGGLTREQFVAAMRTGRSPHQPDHVLRVMPWPLYRHLSDQDLGAMYEYLRAIPPAQPGTCTRPGE